MTLIDPEDFKNANENDTSYAAYKLKTPKRVLHFSDGVLEEYSDDEVDCSPKEEKAVVDTSKLGWGPWIWYKTWSAGSRTISTIDTVGEFMAYFLGITSPKYYFELEEYKSRSSADLITQEQSKGWSKPSGDVQLKDITVNQPSNADPIV